MALRALILAKKIEGIRAKLQELREKETEFEKREADLEAALEEATKEEASEEDVKLVEEEVEKFEKEKEEHDEEVGKLEKALEEAEASLKEEERKNPSAPQSRSKKNENTKNNEGSITEMRHGFFAGVTVETRQRFMQQQETRDFLECVRELKGEKRGVTGAELTIPDNVLEILRDNMNRYSKLIGYIKLKPIKGTARQNIAGVIPEGIWMEAIESLKELEISFNQIEVDGYKVGGYMAIPNAVLEDSDISLASEILDALGQAIGLAVDKAILYGNKKKMPLGIVTRLAQTTKPDDWNSKEGEWIDLHTTNILKFNGTSLEGAKFFKELIKNLGVAVENYSDGKKIWCMNSKTKMSILAEAVTFNAAGSIVAGVNDEMPVIGGKIITLDFIPEGDIIGGFCSLYLLAERKGGTFAQSDVVLFIEDMTAYKGTARYDGRPVIGRAFVAVNINNKAVTTTISFSQEKEQEEPEDEPSTP